MYEWLGVGLFGFDMGWLVGYLCVVALLVGCFYYLLGVFVNVYFNDDFAASGYAFDTTRKAVDIAGSLLSDPIDGVTLVDPSGFYPRTAALVREVHSAEYVTAVTSGGDLDLAESQGFLWDEGLPVMALAHSAGVVAAVYEALSLGRRTGSLSSGLHHARFDYGSGFCTFNGLAVAARAAVEQGASVLVLDFDAHCGGGTSSLLPDVGGRVVQVDVSVSGYDSYGVFGDNRLIMSDSRLYEQDIERALDYAAGLGGFDLLLYNAGMDPFNCGVSREQLAVREGLVADFSDSFVPAAAFVLAGGYTWGDAVMGDIVDLHRLTISSFASTGPRCSTMV